jgi:uncharacterized protein (TIGR03437 family)
MKRYRVALLALAYCLPAFPGSVPLIFPGGLVNAGSAHRASQGSPGSLISIYGTDFAEASQTATLGPAGTLPLQLAGVEVLLDGAPLPLFYVSPGQINSQVPFGASPGLRAVVVRRDGVSGPAENFRVLAASPGIFLAVRASDFRAIAAANPVAAGEVVVVLCTGLGAVSSAPPAATPTPLSPLAHTILTPRLTLGGVDVPVIHSVLTPGFIGLYQVAFTMPDAVGRSGRLIVTADGADSNPVELSIHPAVARLDVPPRVLRMSASSVGLDGATQYVGRFVRIDVALATDPDTILSGTLRVTSATRKYDSGARALALKPLMAYWDTTGLDPADDYVCEVTLTDPAGRSSTDRSLALRLVPEPPSPTRLVSTVDLAMPARGVAPALRRDYLLNSRFDGPLGFGWSHTFSMFADESPDGTVKIFGWDGTGIFFQRAADGAYTPPKGEFGALRRTFGGLTYRTKSGTAYVFDSAGRLYRVQDRNSNTVSLSYDDFGRLHRVTDASGQDLTFAYYYTGRRLSSVTDAAGHSVRYDYDAQGNLSAVTALDGGVTKYEYDADHKLAAIVDPAGVRTTFRVDSKGRLVEISKPNGVERTTYEYGVPRPDQITVRDALGAATVLTADSAGRIVLVLDAAGRENRYAYDADNNLVAQTDAAGRQTTFSYDSHGNMASVRDALGNVRRFEYDAAYNFPASSTDPNGNTYRYAYDSAGNNTQLTFPDGSQQRFAYDAAGQLSRITDRAGRSLTLTRDNRGLVTAKAYPDGTAHRFTYSPRGNLLSASNAAGVLRFEYDEHDRLTSSVAADGRGVSYLYDAAGRRNALIYPGGSTVRYTYDAAGRLTTMVRDGVTLARYTYDDASRPVRRELENGTYTVYAYNSVGRISEIRHFGPRSNPLSAFEYTYDTVGNVLSVKGPAGVRRYEYDALDQMTAYVDENGRRTTYMFDATGNRTSRTSESGVTEYRSNALTQYAAAGETSFSYDAGGNVTSAAAAGVSRSYEYDFDNRLVRALDPAGTTSFQYDPLYRRVGKSSQSGNVAFAYDGVQMVQEATGTPAGATNMFYGVGPDELLSRESAASKLYYLQDALGSVVGLTDATGALVAEYSYDPYGKPLAPPAAGNRFLFTGREYDPEIGLYYFRARFYDPTIGHFYSADPTDPTGSQRGAYTYVGNNPLKYIDPFGLTWQEVLGRLVGIAPSQVLKYTVAPVVGTERVSYSVTYYSVRNGDVYLTTTWGTAPASIGDGLNLGSQQGDPTFVQCPGGCASRSRAVETDGLKARIVFPPDHAQVSADVPIFGDVGGADFVSYRIEVGQGAAPAKWRLIGEGASPAAWDEKKAAQSAVSSPDASLAGNLSTWRTGLLTYSYGDYRKDTAAEFPPGTYTVRLTVVGKRGRVLEDRVVLERGTEISNVYGGRVASGDGLVVLEVAEHALTDSFRVLSIRPFAGPAAPGRPPGNALGAIYEVVEPEQKFTREAEFAFTLPHLPESAMASVRVYALHTGRTEWEPVPVSRRSGSRAVIAKVRQLARYYALFLEAPPAETSMGPAGAGITVAKAASPRSAGWPSIEAGHGAWTSRFGETGPTVGVVSAGCRPGRDTCRRVAQSADRGNLAVTLRDTPFDAKALPVVRFAYRIPRGVKTSFLARMDGRWYDVEFTDSPKEYRRINIERIGRIGEVADDDSWRVAEFNLYEMLRDHPPLAGRDSFIVDELILADWDCVGYLKLIFGRNSKDAAYYLDEFELRPAALPGSTPSPARVSPPPAVSTDFDASAGAQPGAGAPEIRLPLQTGGSVYAEPFGGCLQVRKADLPSRSDALHLAFDLTQPTAFCGYYLPVNGKNLRAFGSIGFWLSGALPLPNLRVALKDSAGAEAKLALRPFVGAPDASGWRRVAIPLAAFGAKIDLAAVQTLTLLLEQAGGPVAGSFQLADVAIDSRRPALHVADCSETSSANIWGEDAWVFKTTKASIESLRDAHGCMAHFSGIVSARYEESWAGWGLHLDGVDVSAYDSLVLTLRRIHGVEKPNLYLDDGMAARRISLDARLAPGSDWQTVTIPLAEFIAQGANVGKLKGLALVFEWQKMSGAVAVRDLAFTRSGRP